MTARADQLTPPRLQWLLLPLIGVAAVATMVEVLRRRATEPIVGRMSDEWLREQTARAD